MYGMAIIYISLLILSVHNVGMEISSSLWKNKEVSNRETLALLYPPGMIGGYRNQVMRFVALVRNAQRYGQTQLLLPSILFSTTYKGQSPNRFFPIPMEDIFDVEYWNRFEQYLPILVNDTELVTEGTPNCWNIHPKLESRRSESSTELLQQLNKKFGNKTIRIKGADEVTFVSPMLDRLLEKNILLSPIQNISTAILSGQVELLKPRKFDLTNAIEDCTQPYVYGGGRLGGRLWNEYVHMPKFDPSLGNQNTERAIANSQFISLVSQALLPSRRWRNVAHQCVMHHQILQEKQQKPAPYIALHARIETDMLEHPCGKEMEKNLDKIFSMTESMLIQYNDEHQEEKEKLQGIVLAVSRYGMQISPRNHSMQEIVDKNWKTLQEKSQSFVGKQDSTISKQGSETTTSIFECGEIWMDRWYSSQYDVQDDYYGSLLPSVLNFYIATHATIFIGVEKSSWSTDVWTSRYERGKGHTNWMYTKNGIIPVPNGGLPAPHGDC